MLLYDLESCSLDPIWTSAERLLFPHRVQGSLYASFLERMYLADLWWKSSWVSTTFSFSRLGTVSALSHQRRTLSYSLVSNPHNLFTIHHLSGEISMTKSVDYETEPHQFLLLVRASEDHQSLASTAEVSSKCTLSSLPDTRNPESLAPPGSLYYQNKGGAPHSRWPRRRTGSFLASPLGDCTSWKLICAHRPLQGNEWSEPALTPFISEVKSQSQRRLCHLRLSITAFTGRQFQTAQNQCSACIALTVMKRFASF